MTIVVAVMLVWVWVCGWIASIAMTYNAKDDVPGHAVIMFAVLWPLLVTIGIVAGIGKTQAAQK
jgi:hypothetical protein